MAGSARRVAAAAGGAVVVAAAVLAVVVRLVGDAPGVTVEHLVDAGTKAALGLAGAWLAGARPRHPIGWLLLLIGLLESTAELGQAWAEHPAAAGGGQVLAAWLASFVWFPGLALLPTVVLALYPTGRAGSRARRQLVGAAVTGIVLFTAGFALVDDGVDDIVPGLENPVAVPDLGLALVTAGAVLILPSALLSVLDAGRRLWRSASPEREQLAWLLTAIIVAVVLAYAPWTTVRSLGFALLPLAVVVGVLRHRLLDLQVVVRRTLLFAGLTGLVIAVFAVTTATLSQLVAGDTVPVFAAAALVSVGLLPARDVLQRGVDRLVYGDRSDPLRAVASVGRDVAEHGDEMLLPQVLSTVAGAVRSPHVALVDPRGRTVSQAGTPAPGVVLRLPLQVSGRHVGTLLVAPRTVRDGWSSTDRRLLDLLARQVAVVAHAAALNAELAGSRDQVVTATADERQRLRQELHDGLGPALSGIALGLEAAEAALPTAPQRTATLLARLRAETQEAGREVRRLVEGLRPSALDRQGLDVALAAFVDGLRDAMGHRLDVVLELPDALPPLPPETDAAAYRIVTEAVTNVVRHSGATRCRVVLAADADGLHLVVEDDGHGLPAQPRDGVGLSSMRRRAVGLGGSWDVQRRDGGGTRIKVVLPAPAEVST